MWGFLFATLRIVILVFFFFQAEDGIRDVAVTGVQTCALPISKVSDWTVRSESDGPLGIDGLTRMTLHNEWPRIRAKLDSREPVTLCLIRGAGDRKSVV